MLINTVSRSVRVHLRVSLECILFAVVRVHFHFHLLLNSLLSTASSVYRCNMYSIMWIRMIQLHIVVIQLDIVVMQLHGFVLELLVLDSSIVRRV
jgi:hypothetical protein